MLTYFQNPKTTLPAVAVVVVVTFIVGLLIGIYGVKKSGFGVGFDSGFFSKDINFPKKVDSNFKMKLYVNKANSAIVNTLSKTIKDVNKTAEDNEKLKKKKGFQEEVLIAVAALDVNTDTGLDEVRVVMSSKNPDGTWKTISDSAKPLAEASTLMDNYLGKTVRINQALQNLPDKK